MINSQAPIYAAPVNLRTINVSRLRQYRRVNRMRSAEGRSRFKPNVNKSFTCYNESALPSSPKRTRNHLSSERTQNISFNDSRGKRKRRSQLSSSKLQSGHPGPSEDTSLFDFTMNPRQEMVVNLMEKGNTEMQNENYPQAIKLFNSLLREDNRYKDALYNRAVCYMHLSRHKLAIPDLLAVEKEDCYYDSALYIALAMWYVKANEYEAAIRQISKGLVKFPKFVDGYVTRAKLFIQQQKWDKAISDCYKAITLRPDEGMGYSILGDALKGIQDVKSALQAYGKAIACEDMSASLKRSKLFFELSEFDKALKDTDEYLNLSPYDSDAYYQKGQILVLLRNENDAVLAFEQCVKNNKDDKRLQATALYNVSVIKIRQKDFYGAMFTFDRIPDKKLLTKEQMQLKKYSDAVLCLIKRDYRSGVVILNQLIKHKSDVLREYIGACYSYRGFGQAAMEEHSKAMRNFRNAGRIEPMDKASNYNRMISEGIMLAQKEDFERAIELFSQASELFDRNMEPHWYKAMTYAVQSQSKTDKTTLLTLSKECLEKAIEIKDSEAELYYYRGLITYYLGNPIDAIPDLELAIDKAEDNLAKHFIARGLCYGVLKLYKEAFQEFGIALQVDENCTDAYYYRGRWAYILDDSSQAFMDFQKVILNSPDDPMVHVHAGNLLMLTGSYEDAIKAFGNANSIKPTLQAQYQIIKCHLLTETIEPAMQDLMNLASNFPTEKNAPIDRDGMAAYKLAISYFEETAAETKLHKVAKGISALKKLIEANSNDSGEIFKNTYLNMYRGTLYLYAGNYKKAKVDFVNILENTSFDQNDRTAAEILYNLVATCVIFGRYEEAIDMLKELLNHCSKKLIPLFMFLNGVLYILTGNQEKAQKTMTEVYKYDPELVNSFLDKGENKVIPINPYPSLTIDVPPIEVKVKQSSKIAIYPAFDLPKIKMPSMSIKIDDSILKEFKVKNVPCKPEAPWLNRVKGMIQFTENIQEIDQESLEPSESEGSDDESRDEEPEEVQSAGVVRKYKSAVAMTKGFDTSEEEQVDQESDQDEEEELAYSPLLDDSSHRLAGEDIAARMGQLWTFEEET